ncbi:phage tail protein [Aeromonas caviae]|uniref:phage tail protein n=1 Tax=Aeromonas caviae TaxID=648 RepID=UPI002B475C74|nr:phage tail protein [Aeromonas caviae]
MNTLALYFSATTGGFYDHRIHQTIPDDAKLLSDDEYHKKLSELSIGSMNNAYTGEIEYLLINAIAEADHQIFIIKPAVDGGYAKPDHIKMLADWQRYRYELVLMQESPGWPESPQWPQQPEAII